MRQIVLGLGNAALVLIVLILGYIPALADSGLAVADGTKVTIEYTLTLPDKTVADSNVGQEPFSYIQGSHQIVSGLEKNLAGMKTGQKKRVEVPAEQGYGPYDSKNKVTVDKSKVPAGVKTGQLLRSADGRAVTVAEVSEKTVVLDLNHPLAGKDLVFDVKILNVEPQDAKPAGKAAP
jgi:FKBP-type peptidyl-prolyl cis-trans isomerase 2